MRDVVVERELTRKNKDRLETRIRGVEPRAVERSDTSGK